MDLPQYLRIQAHANRLANLRLHSAVAVLGEAELKAPRTSFFPSLMATFEHILEVDGYYIAALRGEPDVATFWARWVPSASFTELVERQRISDERLIDFTTQLDAAGCEREVQMPRSGGRIQRDLACHVLAHLFMHQTHHRGQAHAMLSGTSVAPPQLDEFLMSSEGHLRTAEMQRLGWREEDVWGP